MDDGWTYTLKINVRGESAGSFKVIYTPPLASEKVHLVFNKLTIQPS